MRFVSEVGSSVACAVPTLAERWELLQLEKVHRARNSLAAVEWRMVRSGHTGLTMLLFTTCWQRLCSPFWPGLKDPGSHPWDKQQRALNRMRNTLGPMQAWPGVVGMDG